MFGRFQRLTAVAILAGWLAPSVGALGFALHLASDHHRASEGHRHHPGDHRGEIVDLLQTATHGHRHDSDIASDHDHDALLDGPPAGHRAGLFSLASLTVPVVAAATEVDHSTLDRSRWRGPPKPLFNANCSLLL